MSISVGYLRSALGSPEENLFFSRRLEKAVSSPKDANAWCPGVFTSAF
jgi:hypothetical protein